MESLRADNMGIQTGTKQRKHAMFDIKLAVRISILVCFIHPLTLREESVQGSVNGGHIPRSARRHKNIPAIPRQIIERANALVNLIKRVNNIN